MAGAAGAGLEKSLKIIDISSGTPLLCGAGDGRIGQRRNAENKIRMEGDIMRRGELLRELERGGMPERLAPIYGMGKDVFVEA